MEFQIHSLLNISLFGGAAIFICGYIILSIKTIHLENDRKYSYMRIMWMSMKVLTLITALVMITNMVLTLLGYTVSREIQYWSLTLVAANMFGATAVSFSRLIYDRTRMKILIQERKTLEEILRKHTTQEGEWNTILQSSH
jgi:hypothetical protein